MSLVLAALLLTANSGTSAQDTIPVEPPAAKAISEKKICKVDPSYTGSRMKKKLCLTESQWEARSGKSAGDLKTMGAR